MVYATVGKHLMNNLQKFNSDLEALVKLGEEMRRDLAARHEQGEDVATKASVSLEGSYQDWYTEAHMLIKQLLPSRLTEFEQLYKGDGRRKQITVETFNIQDWLIGVRAGPMGLGQKAFNDFAAIVMRFQTQFDIVRSVRRRFDSSLSEIKQLLQADLFDSELDASRELASRVFLRAAGAVAGVVLEKHLGQVADNHNFKIRKKDPTIGDFNELLKNEGVLDLPSWRQIQHLGDIRNLCDHNKGREPTSEEVEELVSGVDKCTKTLF